LQSVLKPNVGNPVRAPKKEFAFCGWFAFIVPYLAFWAGNLNFWQSSAVFISSGGIVLAVIAVAWISWALKWD